jgi:two-component system phosphate regulon sensor histidine kinase PhoR
MLSFRKKILLFDVVLFAVFVCLLFPFVESSVKRAKIRSLRTYAKTCVQTIEVAPDLASATLILQQPQFHFVSPVLYNQQGTLVWGSHLAGMRQLEKGALYSEAYSLHYGQTFGFVQLPLIIDGHTYFLQVGFPLQEIQELSDYLKIGFFLFGALFLVLFSSITQFILHRITRPMREITRAILRYSEGHEEFLPQIVLKQPDQGREFDKIAFTLNSLSERIQKEMDLLVRQKKETEGILESLGEGVIAFNPVGEITFANRVACQMLVTEHEGIIGKTLDKISSRYPDLLKRGKELIFQVFQTSESTLETWTLKTGNRIYLDLLAAPLAQQNGAILVLQDKTSDYKVVEMGKDFIANASHELRTPITIIRGFTETLQDIPNLSKKMLNEITEKIVRTCGRLEKLVKGLLTLSDIENFAKVHIHTVDLKDLVENCKILHLTLHPETKVAFHTHLDHAYISADADLIEMAIQNLLENAVKYSQGPANIEIRIRKEGQRVFLDIQDKGIGIPESDILHIFDRFYTVDKARSRKSGGAGLGLSIVKTIVEKHAGRISVVSKVNQGTIFIITLPLKEAVSPLI